MTEFKRFRVANFMTQKQMARKLGVSHVSVSRWESGDDQPHPKRYRQISRLLKIKPYDLTKVIDADGSQPK